MLCELPCNAVGLGVVTSLEQQCDAVMNSSLYVLTMLYNVDDAVLLHAVPCMLCFVSHPAIRWAWILLMLQCCLCPCSACCDLDAMLVGHTALQWAWMLWISSVML